MCPQFGWIMKSVCSFEDVQTLDDGTEVLMPTVEIMMNQEGGSSASAEATTENIDDFFTNIKVSIYKIDIYLLFSKSPFRSPIVSPSVQRLKLHWNRVWSPQRAIPSFPEIFKQIRLTLWKSAKIPRGLWTFSKRTLSSSPSKPMSLCLLKMEKSLKRNHSMIPCQP